MSIHKRITLDRALSLIDRPEGNFTRVSLTHKKFPTIPPSFKLFTAVSEIAALEANRMLKVKVELGGKVEEGGVEAGVVSVLLPLPGASVGAGMALGLLDTIAPLSGYTLMTVLAATSHRRRGVSLYNEL